MDIWCSKVLHEVAAEENQFSKNTKIGKKKHIADDYASVKSKDVRNGPK